MGGKLRLASLLLVLAVVLSLVSIGMSLSFKNFTPIVSKNVVPEVVYEGTPVGNIGLVVESNNLEGSLKVNDES